MAFFKIHSILQNLKASLKVVPVLTRPISGRGCHEYAIYTESVLTYTNADGPKYFNAPTYSSNDPRSFSWMFHVAEEGLGVIVLFLRVASAVYTFVVAVYSVQREYALHSTCIVHVAVSTSLALSPGYEDLVITVVAMIVDLYYPSIPPPTTTFALAFAVSIPRDVSTVTLDT